MWLKVIGDSSITGSQMRSGSVPLLNDEQLAILEAWIENGAQNN